MQHILILEDDMDLAQGIKLSLLDDTFTFVVCHTLKDAYQEMENKKFDLHILDINLPDGSGLSVCQHIRKIWMMVLCN